MPRITTSKGLTYEVEYAWAPLMNGHCGIGLRDPRPLPAIAQEFDGLTSIHLMDDEARLTRDFEGYTRLTGVTIKDGVAQLQLEKPR